MSSTERVSKLDQSGESIATRYHRLHSLEKGERLVMGVNYREPKNGSLLVLTHGLGSKKESFADIWAERNLRPYGLLIPDLIGFGKSSKPQDFSYSLEDQVKAIQEVLKRVQYRDITLVGHSMGGSINLLLAKELPVKKFVGIEPVLSLADCPVTQRAVSKSYEEFSQSEFGQIKQSMVNKPEKGTQLRLAWLKECDPLSYYKSGESLVHHAQSGNLLEAFNALTIPKVFLYGDQNADLEVLSQLDENTEKIQIPQSNHFVMNDNPTAFYQTLIEIVSH